MKYMTALAVVMALSFGSGALADNKPVADTAATTAPVKEGKKFDREKYHAEKFAKIDKDGDGVLSRDEFLASHKERAEKAFEAMDADKDGKLTKDELKEGRKKWHKKMHKRGGKPCKHKDAPKAE